MQTFYNFLVLTLIFGLAFGKECPPNSVPCQDDPDRCIPIGWVCNGNRDCADGIDEPEDPALCPPCKENELRCDNARCVSYRWVCDGNDDCGDGSDEFSDPDQCPACKEGQNTHLCDDHAHCKDRGDEFPDNPEQCPACKEGEFRCASGRCIYEAMFCDGWKDCADRSDEPEGCPKCPLPLFPCANGGCLPPDYVCNDINNCGDWSDETEEACPCKEHEIRCPSPPVGSGRPGACIPPEYICDPQGIWDCTDGWDEANCTRAANIKTSKILRRTNLK